MEPEQHMNARLAISLAIALAAAFSQAIPLSAQSSTTRGWSLALQAQGTSLSIEDADADQGGGAGLRFGYGLNRSFTLFLQTDGGLIDVEEADDFTGEWRMGHVDLGVRFHFANSLNRWIPFLEAAAGVRAVSVEAAEVEDEILDVSFSGSSFSLGGGVQLYLNETLALELDGRFTSGQFTDIDVGNITVGGFDIDAQSTRLGIGLVWWP